MSSHLSSPSSSLLDNQHNQTQPQTQTQSNKRARLTRTPTPATLVHLIDDDSDEPLSQNDDLPREAQAAMQPPLEDSPQRLPSGRSYSPTLKILDDDDTHTSSSDAASDDIDMYNNHTNHNANALLALDTDTNPHKRIRVDPDCALATNATKTIRRVRFDELKNTVHLFFASSPPHPAATAATSTTTMTIDPSSQESSSSLSFSGCLSPPFTQVRQRSPPSPERPFFQSYSPPPADYSSSPSSSPATFSPILDMIQHIQDVPEDEDEQLPPPKRQRSPPLKASSSTSSSSGSSSPSRFVPRRPRNTTRPAYQPMSENDDNADACALTGCSPNTDATPVRPRVPMLKREASNVSFMNSYPVGLEDRAEPILRTATTALSSSPLTPRASSPLRPTTHASPSQAMMPPPRLTRQASVVAPSSPNFSSPSTILTPPLSLSSPLSSSSPSTLPTLTQGMFPPRMPTLTKTTSDLTFSSISMHGRSASDAFGLAPPAIVAAGLKRSRSLDDLTMETQSQFEQLFFTMTPPDSQ
ncbi:hypothetical protein BGZ94_001059 [Podila epigama]|nr:hypothetical protein BGZ94_001059 [Podila epigama]